MKKLLKNKIILLVVLFLVGSCTGVNTKVNSKDNYKQLYDTWKIEELNKKLVGENNEEIRNYYLPLIEKRVKERDEFYIFNKKLKSDLQNNNYVEVEKNLDLGMGKYIVLKYLKTIDFSNVSVFLSKGNFYKNEAQNIMALNYGTHTVYLDVEYSIKKGKWKVTKISEKRG